MKEAVGELNMTVIAVVAIAAIAGLFYIFVWPMIQRAIVDNTCSTFGEDYRAVKQEQAGETVWYCCTTDYYNPSNCKSAQ